MRGSGKLAENGRSTIQTGEPEPMNESPTSTKREREGHTTPMTARVLAQTGGWPAIIHEEYAWLIEDEAEAAATVRTRPENETKR